MRGVRERGVSGREGVREKEGGHGERGAGSGHSALTWMVPGGSQSAASLKVADGSLMFLPLPPSQIQQHTSRERGAGEGMSVMLLRYAGGDGAA